ncbi:ATP-binding protein [Aureispira sp. CCB-E]|uniref:tetratricopeptide repeat-containing sensor histidine kinase n=1 Tax=Aureispira sp. CCB-E TaxID=3051121 RepID=UPI0028693519|nr:ATP-binding protein [Aureispira sp. CCB-E]WMX16615.1 ATP-binding protein [Aureispira sp. CCB-E]
MLRSIFLFFCFIAINNHSKGQSESTITMDSLIRIYEHSKTDSTKIIWGITVVHHLGRRNPNKAKFYALENLKLTQETGNLEREMEVLLQLAVLNGMTSNFDSVIVFSNHALLLAKQLNDSTAISSCLGNIGLVYRLEGDYKKAIDHFFQQKAFIKKAENKISANNNIGQTYFKMESLDSSMNYYRKSYNLCGNLDMQESRCCIPIVGIGACYEKQNQLDSAMFFFKKALDFADKNHLIQQKGYIYNNIGRIKRVENNCTAAIKLFEQSLAISEKVGDRESFALTKLNLADCYKKEGSNQLSKGNFLEGISILKELGLKLDLKEPYYNLYQLYKDEKDYEKALKWHEKYKESNDTFLVEQIKGLSLFREKLKERELEIAKMNEKVLTNANAQKQLFIVVLSFVMAIVLLVSYLFKKQNNQIKQLNIELSQREEEERFLRIELKHRVKNNLSILQGIVDTEELLLEQENDTSPHLVLFRISSYIQALAELYTLLENQNADSRINAKYFFSQLESAYKKLGAKTVDIHIKNAPDVFYSSQSISYLAYIFMELISNSLKYAFEQTLNPCINVHFNQKQTQTTIIIEDNGKGMAIEQSNKSLGTSLVKEIVNLKLNGDIQLNSHHIGTQYILTLPNNSILWNKD